MGTFLEDLANEILNGPLAVELAPFVSEGNDGAIAAALNRKDITAMGVIQTKEIQRYLFLKGFLLSIEAKTNPTRITVTRLLELFPYFTLSRSEDLAQFISLADALIADGDLGFTETNKNELLAMAEVKISRAEQLGITVTVQDVAQALRPEGEN